MSSAPAWANGTRSSARAAPPGNLASRLSSPMCLAPMARAPLRPWAIASRNSSLVYYSSFLNPKGGFYAEYAAVKADDVSRIPGELTIQQAGAMPVDAMTALRGLDDTLALKPGESVMIFGASGGIGHLAVQLAKRMGDRVFAVASGSDAVALVNRLG